MGLFAIAPQGGTGTLNRDFSAVLSDGRVYCYDAFKSVKSAGGIGLGSAHGIVLLSLPTSTTLKIEKQGTDGTRCGAATAYAFTVNATTFER
ncbi:MAG: hypothetical protein EXR93_10985 [Gemmatimonadetes bacterium]|nr:hypothetical protein [Gemmatimonadota bacterium]